MTELVAADSTNRLADERKLEYENRPDKRHFNARQKNGFAMIRHIVLIKFRKTVSEAEIAKSLDRILSLRTVVPGILSIAVGKSESPEKIERGFMHGFVADFSDWDALARYQVHPEHKNAGAELVRLAEGGLNGILVFDLPVNDNLGTLRPQSVS